MSTVMYRGGDEQFHHYTVVDDWPCGAYFTQSLGEAVLSLQQQGHGR
ncbi:hypothetical protein [Vibrio variabilis]|nr:hypothetical protein [Vibrio variabilis]